MGIFTKKLIGPKCSKCCLLTSVWGIVMFLLMGIAFYLKSPALYEDIALDFDNATARANKDLVFESFDKSGMNCLIAAGLYLLVFFFSLWQMRINDRLQAYTVR